MTIDVIGSFVFVIPNNGCNKVKTKLKPKNIGARNALRNIDDLYSVFL
jgi:hypothetical protein